MKGSSGLLLVALGLFVLYVATSKRYECFAGLADCLLTGQTAAAPPTDGAAVPGVGDPGKPGKAVDPQPKSPVKQAPDIGTILAAIQQDPTIFGQSIQS